MLIQSDQILPSQDFLKEKTIRYIFACLHEDKVNDLPPAPLVRRDNAGNLVAIDGHNLIAVRVFRGEPIDVIVANSQDDGLPPTTAANIERNKELASKYETVLEERQRVATDGIILFADLVTKYQHIFADFAEESGLEG